MLVHLWLSRLGIWLLGVGLIWRGHARLHEVLLPLDASWWSVFSAHWVHLDLSHTLGNAIAWSIAYGFYYHQVSRLVALVIFLSFGISVAWIINAQLFVEGEAWPNLGVVQGYAGLSGVLYGLMAFKCVEYASKWSQQQVLGVGVVLLLLLATSHTSTFARWDFPVATLAHDVGLGLGFAVSLGAFYLAPAWGWLAACSSRSAASLRCCWR